MAVDEVLYDEITATAALRLEGGLPLPRGGYRLLACGAGALVDLAGNPLDGDELRGLVAAPEGARSARVVDAGSSGDFTSSFDNLYFFPSSGIFGDGFESGDTGLWSPTMPP